VNPAQKALSFPAGDTISKGTAWLFAQFAMGTLNTVPGGSYNSSEENDLQQAIWWLEGESLGVNNYFVAAASSALGVAVYLQDSTYGEFGTYVLNVGPSPEFPNQDILYHNVPDGGATLSLLGAALLGLGALRRKLS
jgi:hypothetical protein